MIFHFPFSTFHFSIFNFLLSIFLKLFHYSQKKFELTLDFQQQFFNGSFSSQKLTNRKNSIAEKRDKFSDKFSTQNFSTFCFLVKHSAKIFVDFQISVALFLLNFFP